MGAKTIENIPEAVWERFEIKAREQGLAPEALIVRLMEREVLVPKVPSAETMRRMAELRAMTPKQDGTTGKILRELRDYGDIGD
jgi:hypothetical protein